MAASANYIKDQNYFAEINRKFCLWRSVYFAVCSVTPSTSRLFRQTSTLNLLNLWTTLTFMCKVSQVPAFQRTLCLLFDLPVLYDSSLNFCSFWFSLIPSMDLVYSKTELKISVKTEKIIIKRNVGKFNIPSFKNHLSQLQPHNQGEIISCLLIDLDYKNALLCCSNLSFSSPQQQGIRSETMKLEAKETALIQHCVRQLG